ncbi:MAG: polyphosphate polymerase domain-containing protein [Coriobacteriales bacterium]|nr:polyphosphate polymerase domain-containing protein [Coriobacteriales bacterium]
MATLHRASTQTKHYQHHEYPSAESNQAREFVFSRSEKKYLVSSATSKALIRLLGSDLVVDRRGSTMIRNLYLDTPDYALIRRSLERPLYKEKLRVRTYGSIAGPEHEAFVEVKKKLDGRVYKRRLALPLSEVERFIAGRTTPPGQIARELAWSLRSYGPLQPAISVVYERCALTYPGLQGNVRITLDCNLAAKLGSAGDLSAPLDASAYQLLLPEDTCVMEIKAQGAIPLELTRILSFLEVYPTSFSKVGTAYSQLFSQGRGKTGRTCQHD